jgi:hypothetical protein
MSLIKPQISSYPAHFAGITPKMAVYPAFAIEFYWIRRVFQGISGDPGGLIIS